MKDRWGRNAFGATFFPAYPWSGVRFSQGRARFQGLNIQHFYCICMKNEENGERATTTTTTATTTTKKKDFPISDTPGGWFADITPHNRMKLRKTECG